MQHLIDLRLPLYAGGDMLFCRDFGHGALMAMFADADDGNYVDYLNALRDDGFAVKNRAEVMGNRFTTLVRDEMAVTLYYTRYSRTVRVILEPASNRYVAEPAGETVCQPTLTMIGRKFAENNTYLGADANSGLTCFVFRLPDGTFLVYDGGVEIKPFADGIMEAMRSQAPDPEHIVVAGWILSHIHGDHVGGIRRFCREYPGAVELRQVFHNFPSDADIDHSEEKTTIAAYANGTLDMLRAAYPDAKLTKLHTGDCFDFHGAKIETLLTQEDFYTPERIRRGVKYFNDTSLVVRITLAGQKIMMLADTHITQNAILCRMYGDYLKSDLCQVAHHGGDGGTCEVYERIDPSLAFFTTSDELLPIYISRDYNHHLVYDLHLRGYANSQCRTMCFPLPYELPETDEPVFLREV